MNVPTGYCQCGCGGKTSLATQTRKQWGEVKGQPNRFIHSHQSRIVSHRHGHAGHSGRSSTPTYETWRDMKARCLNPSEPNYRLYGGRGISICDRWLTFENFLQDMGSRPEGMTIERLDNDGSYEPSNCRWATPKEQANNCRSNRVIIWQEKPYTLAQLAELTGINRVTLSWRLRVGWSVEKAVTIPVRPQALTREAKKAEREAKKAHYQAMRVKREGIRAKAERDRDFRRGLLCTAVAALLSGEQEQALTTLRDVVNATVGFKQLARLTGIHRKSLMRILSPRGDPMLSNMTRILVALQDSEAIRFKRIYS